MNLHAPGKCGAYGHQKKISDFLELELEADMSLWVWVLGTELGSYAVAVSILKH